MTTGKSPPSGAIGDSDTPGGEVGEACAAAGIEEIADAPEY